MGILNPSMFEYGINGCRGKSLYELAGKIPSDSLSILLKEIDLQIMAGLVIGTLSALSGAATLLFSSMPVPHDSATAYQIIGYSLYGFDALMISPLYTTIIDPVRATEVIRRRVIDKRTD